MVTIITPIEMLVGMSLTRCDKPSAVVKPVMKEKPYFRKSMSILSNLPMLSSAPVSSSDDCLLESPSLQLTFSHSILHSARIINALNVLSFILEFQQSLQNARIAYEK